MRNTPRSCLLSSCQAFNAEDKSITLLCNSWESTTTRGVVAVAGAVRVDGDRRMGNGKERRSDVACPDDAWPLLEGAGKWGVDRSEGGLWVCTGGGCSCANGDGDGRFVEYLWPGAVAVPASAATMSAGKTNPLRQMPCVRYNQWLTLNLEKYRAAVRETSGG